ncbi:DHA2 family efflux MFS transporter permease subunit [Mesorhizobium carmichaelinearum]|uniref:DHA2 family efflux MFS transporter permease subunit n=1 Tax=Mesorhizobium carmichaelinearum TaxID=1208188 RepID=UPI000BA2C0A2|nr:DHA2 family efflux MFS transporter permease subunit [Mesorhizobium carmichaelinearum]
MVVPASSSNSTWVLVLASAANLMVGLDALVVSTALTAIGRDLGASIEALEWTVNAYTLSFAAFLLTAAALGDRFGRRRLFVVGLMLFVVASCACALASSVGWLIAARAVQGVGAAIVMPLALAQISTAFPPDRRGWALGIYSSVAGLSTVLGPIVGGVVTEGLAWRWIFWVNLPIGLVAAVLAVAQLRESFSAKKEAIDLLGLLLATGAALGLVWGLVRANIAGWESSEVLSSLAGGALSVMLLVAWELRSAQPMIPMRFFRLRAFAAGNAVMFFLNAAFMSAIFFMAQFQQVALGAGPLIAGLRLLPWGVAVILGARCAVGFAKRFGDACLIVFGLVVQAAGLAWIALIADPGMVYAEMILPMILTGAGFAVAVTIAQKTVIGAVAMPDIGKASGTLSTIRQLGGAFGVALTVAAFGRAGSHATPMAFSQGFAFASGVSAMLSLAGAGAGLFLAGMRDKTHIAPSSGPVPLSNPGDKR